ncbi:aldo/keto reductase [soil metagenome]
MTSQNIPQTLLRVAPICLGTGGFGSSVADAEGVLEAYAEMGGDFIDTAHNYGDWIADGPRSASEKAIGAWMRANGNRDSLVLATKGGHPKFDAPDVGRLSRKDVMEDLDGSLETLGTDRIDLYWLHKDEPSRPVGEIVETLNEAVKDGRVRYLGASNFAVERIRDANAHAHQNGLAGFVADQVLWSAAPLQGYPYGDPGVGFVDPVRWEFHRETGMAMIPFQSQAFGLFNRMDNGTLDAMNKGFRGFYRAEESAARYGRMREIMDETGLTITQVVLGYLLGQPFPTFPIIGSQSVAQVRDSMAALDVRLTAEQIDRIDGGRKGSIL